MNNLPIYEATRRDIRAEWLCDDVEPAPAPNVSRWDDLEGRVWLVVLTLAVALFIAYVVVWS